MYKSKDVRDVGMADALIVVLYLAAIMLYGVLCGRSVKNLNDFSVSDRKYGLFVVFATLSSSFIGGGFSTGNATQVFSHGIGNIVALWGFSAGQIIIGAKIAPHVGRFKGVISPGGVTGRVYGKAAQVVTGVSSLLFCAGVLGAQIAAIGIIFNVLTGIPYIWGLLIGFIIVLAYSTSGGIKAVIAIDIIQLSVLMIGTPLLLYFAVSQIGGIPEFIRSAPPAYLNILNDKTPLGFISLFLTMMIGEALVPSYIQRLFIGKKSSTTSRSTILSGIVSIPFLAVTGLIGLAAYIINPLMEPSMAMPSLVLTVLPVGVKGIVIAAMLTIVMSSSDSILNGAAISLVNDVAGPLMRRRPGGRESLRLVRASNIIIGISGILVAVFMPNVFHVLLFSYTFWCPVVLVPLAAALLGLSRSKTAFFTGAASGVFMTVFWNYILLKPLGISGTIMGFFANLLVFSYVNYLSKRLTR